MTLSFAHDLRNSGYVEGLHYDLLVEQEYAHRVSAQWPCRADSLEPVALWSSERGKTLLEGAYHWRDKNAAGYVAIEHGQLRASVAGVDRESAEAHMEVLRNIYPSEEHADENVVPVTFWSYGPHGPLQRRRDLDAPSWGMIEENYPQPARGALEALLSEDFVPGVGGQLLLWAGPPGTGKTTALRMLAREWRSWCDLHYIADPDQFFGQRADYMLGVMLDESDESPLPPNTRVIRMGPKPVPRWRVLVLEDSGELLQRDAKEEVGQALSRFLNAVDGMIGRGLRVMVLVTTNEEVGTLHPAVARPGRCAVEIAFPEFESSEARRWLEDRGVVDGPAPVDKTLAGLYAKVEGFTGAAGAQRKALGFA